MTAPYYQDEHVTLYHGDCREITEWLTADVLVTDPPYGIDYRPNHRIVLKRPDAIAGDTTIAVRDIALRAWGASRPALVFGRWDMPRPDGTHGRLIWDKNLIGTGRISSPWGPSDEEVYVIGDWPPIVPGGRAREGGKPSRHSSVLRVQALAPGSLDRPDHTTPKPVPLMELLIAKCPPGVIADPFAGSGSTLVAARNLGRRAVGVELEERYCEIAARRLAQGCLDLGAVR